MNETLLQRPRNIYEQQTHNRRLTTLFILLFIVVFLGIGIGFDLFYGISKVKLLFILPLFILTFAPVVWNFRGKYSSQLWSTEKESEGDFDGEIFLIKFALTSMIVMFFLFFYYLWNMRVWRGEEPTGILLYLDYVMHFLDAPFLRIMPWGTAITIVMTIVLVVTSLRWGPTSIVWSVRNTDPDDYPQQYTLLRNIVAEVSIAAGIPPPEVVIITDSDPNAYAVGTRPENSYLMVTSGLISSLRREELQGIIAHEISHIRNDDTQVMTVITVLFGAVLLLADWMRKILFWNTPIAPRVPGLSLVVKFVLFFIWLFLVLLAPVIAKILAMSVSRQREYLADAGGAELTRNPLALANALEKIERYSEPTRSVPKSIAHFCVVDPLGRKINDKEGFWSNLLGTHPPIQKRIMLLRSMAYR